MGCKSYGSKWKGPKFNIVGKDKCFESWQDRISNSLQNKLTSSKVVNKLQVRDRNLDNLTGYDLIALLE